jgi:hypothetical protein
MSRLLVYLCHKRKLGMKHFWLQLCLRKWNVMLRFVQILASRFHVFILREEVFIQFHELSFEDWEIIYLFLSNYQYKNFIFRVGCVFFPLVIGNRAEENNQLPSLSTLRLSSTAHARCTRFYQTFIFGRGSKLSRLYSGLEWGFELDNCVLAIFMGISIWQLLSCSHFHMQQVSI